MKATIKRPDGTTISVDGATAEDVEKLAGRTTNAPRVCAPCPFPHASPFIPAPIRWFHPYEPPFRTYVGDILPRGITCTGVSIKAAEGFAHNAAAAIKGLSANA